MATFFMIVFVTIYFYENLQACAHLTCSISIITHDGVNNACYGCFIVCECSRGALLLEI